MTRAILNIGLTGSFDNEEAVAIHTLAAHHLSVFAWSVQGGTLVAEVECPDDVTLLGRVHGVCCDLGRDAIAVLPMPEGFLIGPRAQLYGPFDLSKFKQVQA